MTRRRVRARNRLREGTQKLPFAYDLWISTVERNSDLADNAEAIMHGWLWRPTLAIILHGTSNCTKEQLHRSTKSIERQIYPNWTMVAPSADGFKSAIASTDADYIVPLRAGDALSEVALFRFAERLQSDRSAVLLYGDQDEMDDRGRRKRPWFKPRWNEEMFLAQDFLGSAVAIKTAGARQVMGDEESTQMGLSELFLKVTAAADGPIVHIPHILCHVDASIAAPKQQERLEAVERQLRPVGAKCMAGPFETVKVHWPLPAKLPLVSVIVPTRDKVELLSACLDSLLHNTSYRPFEILVIDNGSVEPEALAYLAGIAEQPNVRILRHEGPYNFSAINNRAARQAKGSFLCLLNNDTEVVEPDWLSELMRYAVRPEVGAVGAKLLYDDGSIQHAGVVVGLGEAAGHAHRFLLADDPGYFRQPHIAQFVSAVTAACLVVDKEKFDAVGGFDEGLAVAFNDVDLCLRIEAAGFRNVYVPHAVLMHHESKSRGSDLSANQRERYMRELGVLQERWGTKTYVDPLHNPNLDRYSETYLLRL
jgi:GT2 family glycosyltransferase